MQGNADSRFSTWAVAGRSAAILGLLAGAQVLESQSQPQPGRLSPAIVRQVEDSVRTFMARKAIPGLSIAIAVDGQIAWSAGYGLADVENSVPALASTVYRSASIGKPMTAAAAMQLAATGKLDLDAPIQRYCPAFPEKRWPVTARHLLAHTSGIRHYGGPRGAEEQLSAAHYESVQSALTVFRDDSLLFEPGTKYLYSTYGYTVLGCVIEGAAQQAFMPYMQHHVFTAAHMQQTRDDNPFALIPRRARGYRRQESGELRNSPFADVSNKMPAGGYVTTAEDLVRFALACSDGSLLARHGWDRMVSPFVNRQGKVLNAHYGLGWGLDSLAGEPEVYHGGQTPQVTGILAMLPRRRFAVAVLMNLEGVDNRRELTNGIAKVVLGLRS